MKRLLESELKSITINELFKRGLIKDSSLIMSELTVGNSVRRVDLAFTINEKLIAVEIKSEADTLTRLDGQLETYSEYFDKVIVVAAPKFIPTLKVRLPTNVGLWEASEKKVKSIRRGVFHPQPCKYKLLDFLDVVDLIKLARKFKIKCEFNRYSLENSLSKVPRTEIRKATLITLERKFRASTNRYFEDLTKNGFRNASLNLLSRFSEQREQLINSKIQNRNFWENLDVHIEKLKEFKAQSTSRLNQPNHRQCLECHQDYHNEAVCEDVY